MSFTLYTYRRMEHAESSISSNLTEFSIEHGFTDKSHKTNKRNRLGFRIWNNVFERKITFTVYNCEPLNRSRFHAKFLKNIFGFLWVDHCVRKQNIQHFLPQTLFPISVIVFVDMFIFQNHHVILLVVCGKWLALITNVGWLLFHEKLLRCSS